jgi:hypothetical protein
MNQLAVCKTVFNMTQTDCQISDLPNKEGFVVVHNPSSQVYNGLARINLPADEFKAELAQGNNFVSLAHDVIEQKHRKAGFEETELVSDYLMFVQLNLEPDSF